MSNIYRRSLDELLTRYELHPELRDVYVEGVTDASFFSFVCRSLGRSSIVFYPIDSIDVPPLLVAELKLESGGNRVRVIALSIFFDKSLRRQQKNVLCLVDLDFDGFSSHVLWNRFLMYTCYPCIECFALSRENLERTIYVFFNKKVDVTFFEKFCEILNKIFSLRLVKHAGKPNAAWFEDFTKHCQFKGGVVEFDMSACCKDVARVAGAPLEADWLREQHDDLRAKHKLESQAAVHGHDLVKLLMWTGKNLRVRKELLVQHVLEQYWMSLVNPKVLRHFQPFRRLIAWSNN